MIKMNYEKLLKRGFDHLPKSLKTFNRFEIPTVESKIMGNKTLIENFKTIADKLNRKEDLLAKHLLKEIGTSGYTENRGLVLHGKFSNNFLNQKLIDYCKKYVICEKCNRPDTKIIKNGTILKCEACGHMKPL